MKIRRREYYIKNGENANILNSERILRAKKQNFLSNQIKDLKKGISERFYSRKVGRFHVAEIRFLKSDPLLRASNTYIYIHCTYKYSICIGDRRICLRYAFHIDGLDRTPLKPIKILFNCIYTATYSTLPCLMVHLFMQYALSSVLLKKL